MNWVQLELDFGDNECLTQTKKTVIIPRSTETSLQMVGGLSSRKDSELDALGIKSTGELPGKGKP
jgi:hypothetical protein